MQIPDDSNYRIFFENPLYIILGIKDELKEQILKEIIENYLNKDTDKYIRFIKTSALKNKNIDKAFETIIDIVEQNQLIWVTKNDASPYLKIKNIKHKNVAFNLKILIIFKYD